MNKFLKRTGKLLVATFLASAVCATISTTVAHAAESPVRIKADAGQLYREVTVNGQVVKEPFKPRGANYVRLAEGGGGETYHSTFEPGQYNLSAVRAFLDQAQRDGYNTVRVFIDHGTNNPAHPHGIGRGTGTYDKIYAPYMDNFASFVNEAAARNIYVLPAIDGFPTNSYWWGRVAANMDGYSNRNVDGNNLSYMERGRIMAKAEYMKEFANALIERVGNNKTAILGYQTDNELFFETNKAPFSMLSGTVRPVDGLTYDMSQPAQRQQAADASMVIYANIVKSKLLEADPNALMTVGFFTNQAVKKPNYNGLTTSYCSIHCSPDIDYRVPGRPVSLSAWSKVDFLDIHIYPNVHPYTPQSDLASIEASNFKKPYIIGEFGARKTVYGNNVITAAYAMRDFRVATCKLGAQGWLFWTWNTYEDLASQSLFFKMDENRGTINTQLAPTVQPDPCSTTANRTGRLMPAKITPPPFQR